ncbi:MAG: hypothetical protein H6740_12370 [Alphaproteobacteria bacterium]|nr:hypothetical protein [Alphaproteobacteria bacterium]
MWLYTLGLALAQEPAAPDHGALAPELEERFAGEQRARAQGPPLGPFLLGFSGPCIGAVIGTGYYPYFGTCGCAALSVVGVPMYFWVNDPPLPPEVSEQSPYYIEGYSEEMRRRRTLMATLGSGAALTATVTLTVALLCAADGVCF